MKPHKYSGGALMVAGLLIVLLGAPLLAKFLGLFIGASALWVASAAMLLGVIIFVRGVWRAISTLLRKQGQ